MSNSTIRFSTFPRTEPPPDFVDALVSVFRQHEDEIATELNDKGLKSDEILAVLGPCLTDRVNDGRVLNDSMSLNQPCER